MHRQGESNAVFKAPALDAIDHERAGKAPQRYGKIDGLNDAKAVGTSGERGGKTRILIDLEAVNCARWRSGLYCIEQDHSISILPEIEQRSPVTRVLNYTHMAGLLSQPPGNNQSRCIIATEVVADGNY